MGTDCFWIERIDGTKTDFSYMRAVEAKDKSLDQQFSDACRNAVQNDIDEIKKEFFDVHSDDEGKIKCPITGKKIAIYESKIIHEETFPFRAIVDDFVSENGIEINKDILTPPADGQVTTEFVDEAMKEKFRKFHKENAVLQVVSKNH